MTQEAMWMTLVMGAVIGGVAGWLGAWRMARKLEYHGITLRKWDEDDWQETQARATARLRGEVMR